MMKFRYVAKNVLALLLALSMGACLSGSGSGGADNSGITLSITAPTSAATMDTLDDNVSLAGTASSGMGIFQIAWSNDRGGEGLADGTMSWQVANIALEFGQNRITVIAEDTAGATTSRSIVVNRESGQPGTATLSWIAPTTHTDGSPLTDLSGYKIFYGRMSGIYDYEININNPGIVTYVIESLVPGNWYFALTAYDSAGVESDRSNEVLRQIS